MTVSTAFLKRLGRELRHGVLPIWVLDELSAEGPLYGYLLLERLRRRGREAFPVGPSLLYPTLGRLRALGLVEAFHGTESQGPVRKYYRLTEAGRSSLIAARSLAEQLRSGSAPGEATRTPLLRPAPRGKSVA